MNILLTSCSCFTCNHHLPTGPCIPWDLSTYLQCEFNMGSVSWRPSDGAESYIAIATGLDGHTHQCLTNTTSCTWNDLHCGEEYNVVVKAKADNCTSLPSNSSIIHMGMQWRVCQFLIISAPLFDKKIFIYGIYIQYIYILP